MSKENDLHHLSFYEVAKYMSKWEEKANNVMNKIVHVLAEHPTIDITSAIYRLRYFYLGFGIVYSVSEINCGFCDEFTENLNIIFPEGELYWDDLSPKEIFSGEDHLENRWIFGEGHCVFKYKGKFYDAECPEGVDRLIDLPMYRDYWEHPQADIYHTPKYALSNEEITDGLSIEDSRGI